VGSSFCFRPRSQRESDKNMSNKPNMKSKKMKLRIPLAAAGVLGLGLGASALVAPSAAFADSGSTTYTANQIRKVNVHVGVRSEVMSKPTQDYVRNHIRTAVDVRSLASVDRYAIH